MRLIIGTWTMVPHLFYIFQAPFADGIVWIFVYLLFMDIYLFICKPGVMKQCFIVCGSCYLCFKYCELNWTFIPTPLWRSSLHMQCSFLTVRISTTTALGIELEVCCFRNKHLITYATPQLTFSKPKAIQVCAEA